MAPSWVGPLLPMVVLLALAGCSTEWVVKDGDGDGFTPAEGDCDDQDGDRKPGAQEIWYDGTDQDCKGDNDYDQDGDSVSVDTDCDDEAPLTFPGADDAWYDGIDQDCAGDDDYDADLDGFASDLYQNLEGELGTDCNDGDAAIHPDASEICDDIDNDCDGALDGEDDSVDLSTARNWYADTDSDDYGDPAASTIACDQPEAYVADDTDCDDSLAIVNPGVEEVCDELDNDCDDEVDEGVTTTFYLDSDGDEFGDDAFSAELCAATGDYVVEGGDCNDLDAAVNPGADEKCATVGVDDNCDGAADEVTAVDVPTWYDDDDGDSFGDPAASTPSCTQPTGTVADYTDCDDTDEDVHPDAVEVCNSGIDDDCSGLADDADTNVSPASRTTWYLDGDSDLYGKTATSLSRCLQPSGYVSVSGDCDDTKSAINPGATEVCDSGVDNDCDGQADDLDTSVSASTKTTWYDDDDSDSYGDPATARALCAAPSGTVTDNTDCDDTSDLAHPGLDEVCNDDLDNDCDGTIGDRDSSAPYPTCELVDGSVDDSTWTVEGADKYTLGYSLFLGIDLDKDGQDDVLTGNAGTSSTGSNAGSVTGFANLDASLDPDSPDTVAVTTATFIIPGNAAADRFGTAVTGGVVATKPWIAVGAPIEGSSDKGKVYLFNDPATNHDDAVADADLTIAGAVAKDCLGWALSMTGDVDDDGGADLLVGVPQNVNLCSFAGSTTTSPGTGLVYLINNDNLAAGNTTATATLSGAASGDTAGYSLAWSDVDGDAQDDVLVGAIQAPYSTTAGAGRVYLLDSASVTGSVTLGGGTSTVFTGITAGDEAGSALAGGGDVNGDGYEDMLIGASGVSSDAGAAYLIYGAASTLSSISLSSAGAVFTGAAATDGAGAAVSLLPDTDDDGQDELVVGASKGDGLAADSGRVYLFYGDSFSGTAALSTADILWDGLAAQDRAGTALSGGDVNGDGRGDLLIGAFQTDPGTTTNGGTAHLFLGLGL